MTTSRRSWSTSRPTVNKGQFITDNEGFFFNKPCRPEMGGIFSASLESVITDVTRWDEKAGLRTRCGVRSQVIDVLKAQIKRRPAMKKVSTVAAKPGKKILQPKLTVGLDLGDRNSWYCVLEESGQIQREQRVRTNAKGLREVFGGMPRSRIALEIG